jgi:hypothetical protein
MTNNKDHVWDDIFIAIVSVDLPSNKLRVKKLQSNLKKNGLCNGYIFNGKKALSKEGRNIVVFQTHYDICIWFIKNRPCRHLFILEDDAYICEKNITRKIKRSLRVLDKLYSKWVVLSLGCIASRQMTHIQNDLYNGAGYGAHSYILNGDTLSRYLSKISSERWKAPNCVEHWGDISLHNTYMIHPILFTQNVHFSGIMLILLPCITNPAILRYYLNTVNWLNINRFIIIIFFIFIYILVKLW